MKTLLAILILTAISAHADPVEISPISPVATSTTASVSIVKKTYSIEGAQLAAFGQLFGISDPSKIIGGSLIFSGTTPAIVLTVRSRE